MPIGASAVIEKVEAAVTMPVGGDNESPFGQTGAGAMRNDTYEEGGSFSDDSYPFTVDPSETIYELILFSLPTGQTVDIVTSSGTTISGIEPGASSFVLSTLEIDSVTFNDDGNTDSTAGMWVGE